MMFHCLRCDGWFVVVDESVHDAMWRHVEEDHVRDDLPLDIECYDLAQSA